MRRLDESVPLLLALAASSILASRASGAESWPPTTAPRVDLPAETEGVTPDTSKPTPKSAPAREQSRPSVALPAPEIAAPSPAREPSGASDVPTLVRAPAPDLGMPRAYFGSRDGQLFVRSSSDEVVLLPTARFEAAGESASPTYPGASRNTAWVDQMRVDVAGWAFSKVYLDLSADLAGGPSARHSDEILAIAPWGQRAMLQLGQFDAPFTLENRTPDRYLDFVARSAAVGAFAIPENKDQGLMLHGLDALGRYYYSVALLNGEGPGVSGVSGHLDVMARAWVAPFSFSDPDALRNIRVGGSVWTGDRTNGPTLQAQSTEGRHDFLDPTAWWTNGETTTIKAREQGRLSAIAIELDAPFADRFGFRFEWIGKRQPYTAVDQSAPGSSSVAAQLRLSGFATYAEVWGWVLGSNQFLGAPAAAGLGLPPRLVDFRKDVRPVGVMVAARVDYVDETMSSSSPVGGLGLASLGETKLTSYTLGATCWMTRRARLTLNYVFNQMAGTTPYIVGLEDRNQHEVVLRTAFAL